MKRFSLPLSIMICGLTGLGLAQGGIAQTQAQRGAAVFSQTCAVCHGENLQGSTDAPALTGATFLNQWRQRSAVELFGEISETMPPTRPGSLSQDAALAVTAFILQHNGAAQPAAPLTGGTSTRISELLQAPALSPTAAAAAASEPAVTGLPDKPGGRYGRNGPREMLTLGPPPGTGLSRPRMDEFATAHFAEMSKVLDKVTPVTDAMLKNPPPGDWLMWRRTYNSWGYSPLDQINRDNVKNLTVAWTWGMNSTGISEFTPLEHDGILYLWNYGETIQALDARNGNLLWQFRHDIPAEYHRDVFYRTKRALAIGGDKLIFATTDMHIIALNLKTGAIEWDVNTDDYEKSRRVYNGGPLVVKDKVIMGASGCAPGTVGCFITARNLATGKELWRFNTIAQPGEPGDETWNNLPADKRWGGSIWLPPSYDPDLNLIYAGVGSPFPWSSIDRGTYNPKSGPHGGDSLYVNSTLAINPDTGKLVWYYQHLPNDTYDQDYAFERIIAPVSFEGKEVKAVITAGKPAVIEALNAATGKFLWAFDPGVQNIFTMDPKTGVKTLLPPVLAEGVKRCPSNNGGRNFPAGSYDPNNHRYYLSVNDVCTGKHNDFPDRMIALDLNTHQLAMDVKSRVMQGSAKLTTAGGLLFSADAARYFRAYDVNDGKMLWQTRVQDVPNAFPITYMVDGKQYVAMIVGNAGLIGSGAARATTEYLRPEPTTVLWVWQLP